MEDPGKREIWGWSELPFTSAADTDTAIVTMLTAISVLMILLTIKLDIFMTSSPS